MLLIFYENNIISPKPYSLHYTTLKFKQNPKIKNDISIETLCSKPKRNGWRCLLLEMLSSRLVVNYSGELLAGWGREADGGGGEREREGGGLEKKKEEKEKKGEPVIPLQASQQVWTVPPLLQFKPLRRGREGSLLDHSYTSSSSVTLPL